MISFSQEKYDKFSVIKPTHYLCSDNTVMWKLRDTAVCNKGKLIVCMSKPSAKAQIPLTDIMGTFTDYSLADEIATYANIRLKQKHIPMSDDSARKYINELANMYILEHGACYIGKKVHGEWQGYNKVTRNTRYMPSHRDVKTAQAYNQIMRDACHYLYENEYEQITKHSIRAYSISRNSDGSAVMRKTRVNPHNTLICPCFILNHYVNTLVKMLRKNVAIISVNEDKNVFDYMVSLEDEYIHRCFTDRYEEIRKGLYSPDSAVLNLPVTDCAGNTEVMGVNVFNIDKIEILKNHS